MHVLDRTRAALETAADKILADYRTWVADDTEAKPHYGQIPEYDAVNSAVGEIDSWLTMRGATGAWQRCGLDSDALEVAINAVYCAAMGGDADIENHAAIAVRAYLSASIPADTAELVERLRSHLEEHNSGGGRWHETPEVCLQAASLIQSQAARIAELETFIEKTRDFARELEDDGFYQAADDLLNRRAEG